MTETTTNSGSASETLKRYGTLAYAALGNMLDTGLIVVGTLLIGLGITTLLAGFGIVGSLEDVSTGGLLGSALVLAIVGMFALGVAAEGPLGRGRRLVGFSLGEVAIGRAIASFLVGFGLLLIHRFLIGFVDDLTAVIQRGADGIFAAAVAGMLVIPLVGVPLSLLVRGFPKPYEWVRKYEYLAIFVVWVVATLVGL